MIEQAEKAFVDAENVAGELSNYWFSRGVNLLRHGEHRRAKQYIKKSLDFARENRHAQAYMFLSILHTACGNRQEGERYGSRAEQCELENPYSWGQEGCVSWLLAQGMWPPRDNTNPQ